MDESTAKWKIKIDIRMIWINEQIFVAIEVIKSPIELLWMKMCQFRCESIDQS